MSLSGSDSDITTYLRHVRSAPAVSTGRRKMARGRRPCLPRLDKSASSFCVQPNSLRHPFCSDHRSLCNCCFRPSFNCKVGKVDRRQSRVVLASIVREDRPVIRSNIYSRPALRAFNFASGNPEIAEHVIVHAGDFFDGAPSRQFGLDRSLHSFQDREEPCDGASCDPAPSRLAPQRSTDAMDLISERCECISIALSPSIYVRE
jgi:hypothetical protein